VSANPGPASPHEGEAHTQSPAGVGLVTLIVGDTGRSSGSRGRARRLGAGSPSGEAGTGGSPAPGPRQWSCHWTDDGPGTVAPGDDGEADLTLTLSPDDARSVQHGQLAPSVAFMQGRLKTSGDNGLLLRVLAWTATPAFERTLDDWAKELA
jgi:SCP-2 sterol transfer family